MSLPPLCFSPLTVASRYLHPYSTDDKTPRLKVKQLFTARDTQRDSQSYIGKREEGDGSDQEEKSESERARQLSSQ